MLKDPIQLLNLVAQMLFDKKGFNILALDVRGISTMTDYFLIAEGKADRHVASLAKAIIEGLKERGVRPLHTEGLTEGDWVVVDYGEMVIHLFLPEMREKYRLETLWREGRVVELEIAISGESYG